MQNAAWREATRRFWSNFFLLFGQLFFEGDVETLERAVLNLLPMPRLFEPTEWFEQSPTRRRHKDTKANHVTGRLSRVSSPVARSQNLLSGQRVRNGLSAPAAVFLCCFNGNHHETVHESLSYRWSILLPDNAGCVDRHALRGIRTEVPALRHRFRYGEHASACRFELGQNIPALCRNAFKVSGCIEIRARG